MWDILQTYGLFLLVGEYPAGPLGGLAMTLILAALALVLAFLLGLLLGTALCSPFAAIRLPVLGFVSCIRALPALMIIFWGYFLLPEITGTTVSPMLTVLASLVVFEGAYIAFIVAAGIRGLPKGQMESARALGLPWGMTMRTVVMPQVLRNMLPSLVGEFVSTIKLTSLGSIIGLSEITKVSEQINAITIVQPVQVYAILALTYFLLCFGISRLSYRVERRLSTRPRRRAAAAPPATLGVTLGENQ